MIHPFVAKLRNGANLSLDDEKALLDMLSSPRRFDARGDIFVEGQRQNALFLVLDGWACRYKLLENGKRHIIEVFLPGDLCEPFGILPRFMDHSFAALTTVTLAFVSPESVKQTVLRSPRIEEALWWDILVSIAVQQQRSVSLGRRLAAERLGHFVCEIHERLAMIGSPGLAFDIPLTQTELGDLLGLSPVHVNRSLGELRAAGFLSLRGRQFTIRDLAGLRTFALFDADYLHRITRLAPSALAGHVS